MVEVWGSILQDVLSITVVVLFFLFIIASFTKKSMTELLSDIKNWIFGEGEDKNG